MKIDDRRYEGTTKFGYLESGQCFEGNKRQICMKIDECFLEDKSPKNAVRLADGGLNFYSDVANVIPVDVEAIVE